MMKVRMKISGAFQTLAETLRVLLFMTLAIVVFKFYPLTAIMIVMLALLNDGAILSIAYDNVIYRNKPEAWDTVLGISTVLGVVGVIAAFGLFYLGERVFDLDQAHIQTLMYLKLFGGRSSDDFPDAHARGPARILLVRVVGTQTLATLIAVYGLFMTPLGWGWALFVWGYALAWFLVNDRVKLIAYWALDRIAAKSLANVRSETLPETKVAPKPDAPAVSAPDSWAKAPSCHPTSPRPCPACRRRRPAAPSPSAPRTSAWSLRPASSRSARRG